MPSECCKQSLEGPSKNKKKKTKNQVEAQIETFNCVRYVI